jgi:hypothetical protein
MSNSDLHCFSNYHTTVVAETLEEARSKWDEWTAFSPDGLDQDEIEDEHDIHQISDATRLVIFVEDELKNKPQDVSITSDCIWSATSKAWAQSQGAGYLCGEDY